MHIWSFRRWSSTARRWTRLYPDPDRQGLRFVGVALARTGAFTGVGDTNFDMFISEGTEEDITHEGRESMRRSRGKISTFRCLLSLETVLGSGMNSEKGQYMELAVKYLTTEASD
jgi:hypothetical protein